MNNIGHDIRFSAGQFCYIAGDTVSGIADVSLSQDTSLSALSLTFVGIAEIRWIEDKEGAQNNIDSLVYFSKDDFLKQLIPFTENDVTIIQDICPDLTKKRLAIAFSFKISNEQDLPSSMLSSFGFIKYQVRLTIKSNEEQGPSKNYVREIFLETPLERKRLMIAKDGTTEKIVLLHAGHALMSAPLGYSDFHSPDETTSVFVKLDNETNVQIIPRFTLQQVQITAWDGHHELVTADLLIEPLTWDQYQKSVKMALRKDFLIGLETAAAIAKVKQLIEVILPIGALLSVKNDLITVKYFLALDIPHSPDLNVNPPIALTPVKALAAIQAEFAKCLVQIQA